MASFLGHFRKNWAIFYSNFGHTEYELERRVLFFSEQEIKLERRRWRRRRSTQIFANARSGHFRGKKTTNELNVNIVEINFHLRLTEI